MNESSTDVVVISRNVPLNNFLMARGALKEGEAAAVFDTFSVFLDTKALCFMGIPVFAIPDFDIRNHPVILSKTFKEIIASMQEKFGDRLLFAHPKGVMFNGQKIVNNTVPGFLDSSITHIILKDGMKPMVESIKGICGDHFSISHQSYKNIQILPKS